MRGFASVFSSGNRSWVIGAYLHKTNTCTYIVRNDIFKALAKFISNVLFGEVSSSSGCLGWATLFYCGTP